MSSTPPLSPTKSTFANQLPALPKSVSPIKGNQIKRVLHSQEGTDMKALKAKVAEQARKTPFRLLDNLPCAPALPQEPGSNTPIKKIKTGEVIPQSVVSRSLFGNASSPKVPLTPRKVPQIPRRKGFSAAKVIASPYRDLYTYAQAGTLQIQDKYVNLSLFSNAGSYMSVYSTQADHPIVPSIPNEQLLVKIYNDEKSTFLEVHLCKYMNSSIENYHAAKKLGIDVATIYNIETAQTDRFFLQEKIPHQIDLNDSAQMEQVRALFFASLEHKLILDLLPSNLRLRDDGSVTLIDFVEERIDEIDIFIKHAVSLWCNQFAKEHGRDKALTTQFLADFTRGFDKHGYDLAWNETFLEEIFFEVKILAPKGSFRL